MNETPFLKVARDALSPEHFVFYLPSNTPTLNVEEEENDGKASVTVVLPPDGICIVDRRARGGFSFLRRQKIADGILLFVDDRDQICVCVIECKRTVTPAVWRNAEIQFKWSVRRALSSLGAINRTAGSLILVTAFRDDDEMRAETMSDPVFLKLPVGNLDPGDPALARRRWDNDQLSLDDLGLSGKHVRCKLDVNGDGTLKVGELL